MSKSNKTVIVGGMGLATALITDLDCELREQLGDERAIQLMSELATDENRRPRIREGVKALVSALVSDLITLFSAAVTFFGKTKVKIVYRGDNFTAWFKKLVETSPPQGELKPFDLPQVMTDAEILAQLGGEEKATISLSQVWALMARQANGEAGALLTNGYANLFYVKDAKGNLRVVCVLWSSDGWRCGADALGGNRWGGGRRVFSRNS